MKNILITNIYSLEGSNLVLYLLKKKCYKIYGLIGKNLDLEIVIK